MEGVDCVEYLLGDDGRPGRRVPHVWVQDQGKRISTLDLCWRGLVVRAGAVGPGSASAQTTFRAVNHPDLKILDPIWTTA